MDSTTPINSAGLSTPTNHTDNTNNSIQSHTAVQTPQNQHTTTLLTESNKLIDWNKVIQLFEQLSCHYIYNISLLHHDGTLLCMYTNNHTNDDTPINSNQYKLISALLSNIYKTYDTIDIDSQQLQTITIQCSHNILLVQRVSQFVVCVTADKDAPNGMLNMQLSLLCSALKPLSKVYEV